MSKKNILTILCAMAMFAFGMVSCSNEDTLPAQEITNDKAPHTCKLIFEGDIEKFDAETRAASWANDDTIFLVFDVGEEKLNGKAIFNGATGSWELTYFGVIPDASSTCKAYHFKDGLTVDMYEREAIFSDATAVYGDTEATYIKNGDALTVKAHLKPMTGRIRFKGEVGTKFMVHGMKRYLSYIPSTGELASGGISSTLIVGSDGYTPYVYGTLLTEKRHLWIAYDDVSFVSVCPTTVLADGKSGAVNVPTDASYRGWNRNFDKPFTVNGVFFVMKYVQGGTFEMGATFEQQDEAREDEYPAHEVTLSDYYIGETEVTMELWYAILNPHSTYDRKMKFWPASRVSWNECANFIKRLSAVTGIGFAFPTEAQWEYAARGGNVSKGYKYSGSSELDLVAWMHNAENNVATKMANELGIYDMSGNGNEWCGDYYGPYDSTPVSNPTGPTSNEGDDRVARGGYGPQNEYGSYRVSARNHYSAGSCFRLESLRLALPKKQ